MAGAYLRLKRKRDEEPSDTLVVACKRGKHNHLNSKKDIFKLAGTVASKNEADIKSVIELHQVHSPLNSSLPSTKPQLAPPSKKRCYSLIGHESLQLDSQSEISNSKKISLFDAIISDENSVDVLPSCDGDSLSEALQMTNSEPMAVTSTDDDFVYDIFYLDGESTVYDPEMLDNFLCIEAYDEGYAPFQDYRLNRVYEDDVDDSNDEDNWRNDYPDEDYGRSSGEDYEDAGHDDDLLHRLNFQKVQLASSESDDLDSDYEDAENYPEHKEFLRYYKSYKRERRRNRAVGECDTSDEEREEESDCNDDLY